MAKTITSKHPVGHSEEFGGTVVVRDTGYRAAEGTAAEMARQGYEARMYSEPGFGWYVQARPVTPEAIEAARVAAERWRATYHGRWS